MSDFQIMPLNGEPSSPDYREAVYQAYKDPTRGRRSYRHTGKILGIPFITICKWGSKYGWQQRLWEEDERDAAAVKRNVEMRMINELDNLLDQAFALAYDGKPEDKTKADLTKYLLGVMRVSPVQKVEQDILDNRLSAKSQINHEPERELSREELVQRIMAKLDPGIDDADESEEPDDADYVELPSESEDEDTE